MDEWPAQQIGELGEFMAGGDPTVPLSVRGFGPVAKSWTPRQALAGTFDEHWRRTRHPRMPDDYDFGFWNAAPSALQVGPYLRGDEVVRLTGLDPRPEPLVLTLPGVGLDLRLTGDATAEKAMALDTVALDITGKPVLDLTWRAATADPETYAVAEIGAHALTPAPAPQPEGV